MPDENFVYCFARMMLKYGWTGINQVCGLTGDYRFLQGFCDSNITPLLQQIAPNLFHNLQQYRINAKIIRDSELYTVLTKIANTRGTCPLRKLKKVS